MDLVLFSAIPRAALFFLLLVAAAILAEVIYLVKRKLDSSEVTLPKSLQTPSSLPPQPAMVAVTTEIVSETPKKGRFTKKTTMVILSTLLIALTIPVGLALVKQRQGVEKKAAGFPFTVTSCQIPAGQTSCQATINWNFEAGLDINWAINVNSVTIKNLWHSPTFKENPANCMSDCGCTDAGNCAGKCGYPRCSPHQEDSVNFNMECKNHIVALVNLDNGGSEWIEVRGTGPGCTTATPTPTPTPSSFSMQCGTIETFDNSWSFISNPNTITIGQTVFFATRGSTNEPQGITKARFQINGGAWQETILTHPHPALNTNVFYIQYTVATAGPYTVQGEVFNPALGWK